MSQKSTNNMLCPCARGSDVLLGYQPEVFAQCFEHAADLVPPITALMSQVVFCSRLEFGGRHGRKHLSGKHHGVWTFFGPSARDP